MAPPPTRRRSPRRSWPPRINGGPLLPERRSDGETDGVVRTRAAVRVAWLGGFIGVGFLALTARASSLMLLPDPQLEKKARVQFEESIEVRGRRGDILDRNGALLATTVELYELHADPARLVADPEPDKPVLDDPVQAMADALAPILDLPAAELAERLGRARRRDVRLAEDLPPDVANRARAAVSALARKDRRLRGATWTRSTPSRFYPGREEASVLLGLVGHNGVGRAGLERALDRELQGETFKYVQWRDRKGRKVTPERMHADAGHSVVLTLDRRIQHIAEEAVERARTEKGALYAYAAVVDIPTGELLALANRPAQNPNDTRDIRMDSFTNHAVMDAIEPGSVFKPFVAAAAMNEGLVTPNTVIDCEGGAWRVQRAVIHDDHPKGNLTVTGIIKHSSNIGAAKLAFKLGADRTLDYLRDFGFNRMSGLELPGETGGAMRKAHSIKPIELATTAYGHGVTANAIQLASAVATLGNGGVRMQPRLVKEIRDRHGTVIERYAPEIDRRVISEETAHDTIEMMVTVTEKGGTGTRARVEGYRVAGKTGTAWKHVNGGYSSTDRIGSFVGLIPADDPKLAIAVVVDTPTVGRAYGGLVAGPAFAEIAGESLRVLGIAPDPALLEDGAPEGSPEEDAAPPQLAAADAVVRDVVWAPDGRLQVPALTGLSLRDALGTLQGTGLSVRTSGSGRVSHQSPPPGTPLVPGDELQVFLD